MQATYSVAKDDNYGINKTPRETLVHCSGSASSENSLQVLAITANSGSDRNKFLWNQNNIKPTVTGRVEVVEGESTSSGRQTLKIGMPQFIIQTDASKTGWGQSVRELPRWELGHIRKGQNISMYWSSSQWTCNIDLIKGKLVTAIQLQTDNMTAFLTW